MAKESSRNLIRKRGQGKTKYPDKMMQSNTLSSVSKSVANGGTKIIMVIGVGIIFGLFVYKFVDIDINNYFESMTKRVQEKGMKEAPISESKEPKQPAVNVKERQEKRKERIPSKTANEKRASPGIQKGEGNPASHFIATIHNNVSPVSMTYNGRNIKFKEISHQNKGSSVRVFIADNFLSENECDGLTSAHFRHVQETAKQSPIVCFAEVNTMKKHLREVGFNYKASASDFTDGTTCVNETLSRMISPKLRYSYSTAFYRGDSKFSHLFEEQVEKMTGLAKTHGGKFQITSYRAGVGYKNHTDCTEDDEIRDRFATALVYLQDVKRGGETKFPKLGISVKPKKGRLLLWNNMRPDGSCDPTSIHNAEKVEIGHKVILQRWYYYKSFFSLGKAPPEPTLPKRAKFQPRVSCDQYEQGSCRWYDEWGYDHLVEYKRLERSLS